MWQWQLTAFVKYVFSFFKRTWTLRDYPLHISQQDDLNLPTNGSWQPGAWHAQIINWEQMSAYGRTHATALAELTKDFNAYHRRHGALPRPGKNVPVEPVPTTEIDQYIGVGRDFCAQILEVNFARAYLYDASSLWDFLDRSDEAAVFVRIRQTYQVDVSDIPSGSLVQIFERIQAQAALDPENYPAALLNNQWTIKDYLLRISHQDANMPAPGSLKTIPWFIHVIDWWQMMGHGDTRAEALTDLKHSFNAYLDKNGSAPRPGTSVPLEPASTTEVDRYEDIARDFLRKILELDYDQIFISDYSSLSDFFFLGDQTEIIELIQENYQVDVSDIESGNLVQIFKRIQQHNDHLENDQPSSEDSPLDND